jgi:glycosyltransferase involved in cell wall biosynthesis
MRILFCGSTYLSKELGASKVIIELVEEMKLLGWKCNTVSPPDLVPDYNRYGNEMYPLYLRQYLREHGPEYDVVDYDHHHLPFPRSDFPERMLLVARSVLLQHHLDKAAIPQERSLRSAVWSLLRGRKEGARRQRYCQWAHATVNEADFINVANHDDETELIGAGIPRERIAVIPYGLSRSRASLFDLVSSSPPADPKVAFVGTFDSRKGAADFPAIVRNVRDHVPDVSFRLLGTVRNEKVVLSRFPRDLRSRVEVIPRYDADELPQLLAPCSVGVFPSYLEGFGLGVLEMLAASIPVIAYNSPGPPMMLSSDYLVRRGDVNGLSNKAIELLRDRNKLTNERLWAKQTSRNFCWKRIAQLTSEIYLRQWQLRQIRLPAQINC